MRRKRPSIARGILTGITAGIAATVAMDQFMKLTTATRKATEKQVKLAQGQSPQEIKREQQEKEQQAARQEDSTEILARKIAETAGKTLDSEQKKKAGQAVHYSFGTLMGIIYGVTSEILPEVTAGGGTGFGTLLFLSADVVAVPAFRLAPPPVESNPVDHLEHWAGHVVYGGTLELVRSLVRRLL